MTDRKATRIKALPRNGGSYKEAGGHQRTYFLLKELVERDGPDVKLNPKLGMFSSREKMDRLLIQLRQDAVKARDRQREMEIIRSDVSKILGSR